MGFSKVQERIARAVLGFERRREPAFVADLVRALGYAAESSLTATLRLMERNGFLALKGGGEHGKARVAMLTARGRFALGAGGIPLLGSIPAGPLAEAVAGAEEVLEFQHLLPSKDGDFLLRVRGDSMSGEGILNGDMVLLRPGVAVGSGEIAAVLVGEAHEATLKRVIFRPECGEVVLQAANPAYPDVVVKAEELKVAGVFRGLIRHAKP